MRLDLHRNYAKKCIEKGRKKARLLCSALAVILCIVMVLPSLPESASAVSAGVTQPAPASTAAHTAKKDHETQTGGESSAKDSDGKKEDGTEKAASKEETSQSGKETTASSDTARSNEKEKSSKSATAEETTQAVTKKETDTAAAPTSAAESAETAEAMPARTILAHTNEKQKKDRVTVTVDAPEGALPSDAVMTVKTVTDEEILKKAEKKSGITDGQDDTTQENATKVVKQKAVEITFQTAEGKEIEPKVPVRVYFAYGEIADAGEDLAIVHVPDSGRAEVVKPVDNKELKEQPKDDEVVFDAEQFSVYSVIYTVDFQYGDHDFTLPGDQSVRLSEVLKSLAIPKNEEGDTLTADDIAEVSFSDKKLVGVEKDGDDWTITAKKAFDTEEELTLTLTNGDQVCVAVSDDNETTITSYITSVVTEKIVNGTWQSASEFQDGDSARITISYELTQGVITTEKPSITYQLPDGVTVNEAVSNGIIIVPGTGERQGTYTINKDGLVTLTFDKDEINKGNGFTGDIQFEATVHNTSGESTHSISFGGDSKSITVTKPEESKYDIHTQKTGTLNRKAKKNQL